MTDNQIKSEYVFESRRDARRRVVILSAYAREANARLLEVEISNLSTDGCRLKSDGALEPQTAIWLKIPGITPRRAVIRWTSQDEAGCEFDTPIAEATVEEAAVTAHRTARKLRRLFVARAADASGQD